MRCDCTEKKVGIEKKLVDGARRGSSVYRRSNLPLAESLSGLLADNGRPRDGEGREKGCERGVASHVSPLSRYDEADSHNSVSQDLQHFRTVLRETAVHRVLEREGDCQRRHVSSSSSPGCPVGHHRSLVAEVPSWLFATGGARGGLHGYSVGGAFERGVHAVCSMSWTNKARHGGAPESKRLVGMGVALSGLGIHSGETPMIDGSLLVAMRMELEARTKRA